MFKKVNRFIDKFFVFNVEISNENLYKLYKEVMQMERFNIYHRQDGRYEGRIYKGKRKNGKRNFQYFFGRTREDVLEKMAEVRRCEVSNEECSRTLSAVYREWYRSIRHRVKESTATNYEMKANKHILPTFGKKRIDAVSDSDIYTFMDVKQKQGLSNRYVADIIILMKSIFKYAVKIYHIFNPMNNVVLPKKKMPEIQILDEKEQAKLEQYIAKNPNSTTLGVALSMSTGIRIGELCALQWKDIDFSKRVLTIRKTIQRIQCSNEKTRTKLVITEPKSESSKRSIPIPEFMMEFLKKFQGKSEHYVLSNKDKPVEPRTMQYRFAKILKNVQVPSVHFHALRHMFASTCVKLNFDIKSLSEILGHSSVEITLNRYVHSSFEQKVEYMSRLKLAI